MLCTQQQRNLRGAVSQTYPRSERGPSALLECTERELEIEDEVEEEGEAADDAPLPEDSRLRDRGERRARAFWVRLRVRGGELYPDPPLPFLDGLEGPTSGGFDELEPDFDMLGKNWAPKKDLRMPLRALLSSLELAEALLSARDALALLLL